MNRRKFLKATIGATGLVLFPGIFIAKSPNIKIDPSTVKQLSVSYYGKFTEQNMKNAFSFLLSNFKKMKNYKQYSTFYPKIIPYHNNQRKIEYEGHHFRYVEMYNVEHNNFSQYFTLNIGLPV